jgi:plasmid stability protein
LLSRIAAGDWPSAHPACGERLYGQVPIARKLGNQENGSMKKTTLELPDDLVKRVKLRALKNGQKLKDAVADLLRKGLSADMNTPPEFPRPVITTDKKTGLPVIKGRRTPTPEEVSPERLADILMAQEVEWYLDASR